jgi:predicted RNA-binding protein with TRAM domain
LTWTAPSSNGGFAITNYKYSTNNGSTYTAFDPAVTGTSATITGLTNGTAYQIKIRAVNAAGDGTESAAVSATPGTTPDAPTNLTATAGDTTITLTWKAPSSNGGFAITNYKYSTNNGSTYTAFDPAIGDTTSATITGLTNGTEYEIKLRAVNALGDGAESAAITVLTSSIDEENMPTRLELFQNYPNPFNPSTTVNYSIKEAGAVTIIVYNLMGQKVATLVDETKEPGHYKVIWNSTGNASGMYYYRIETKGKAITRKMTLIK